MSIILKNGVVFDGFTLGTEREDILVKDGVVARRGADLAEEGARLIDCAGRIVCPGFIDLHAHFRDPGFNNLQALSMLTEGGQVADVVVAIATIDMVLGGVDR